MKAHRFNIAHVQKKSLRQKLVSLLYIVMDDVEISISGSISNMLFCFLISSFSLISYRLQNFLFSTLSHDNNLLSLVSDVTILYYWVIQA